METFDESGQGLPEGQESQQETKEVTTTSTAPQSEAESSEDWVSATIEESEEDDVTVNTNLGVFNHYPDAFATDAKAQPASDAIPLPTTHPIPGGEGVAARYGDDADEEALEAITQSVDGVAHALYTSLLDTVQDEQSLHFDVTHGGYRYNNLVETRKGNIGLKSGAPAPAKGKELTGRNALLSITSHMGVSNLSNLPDVNSGIRIVYRAPNTTEMAALDERLAKNKDTLGYYTLGLSHSFADSFSQEILFDFLMDYIVECNLKDWKVEGVVNVGLLQQVIRKSSLKHHYLAIQAAYYSRGYPVVRVCTSSEATCAHVMRGNVNFEHTYWILEDQLTTDQMRFMTKDIKHQHTLEEVLKYQESLKFQNDSVEITGSTGKKICLEFATPTLAMDLSRGAEWIKATRRIIVEQKRNYNDATAEQRFVRKLVESNQLRLFTSWIKRIVAIHDDEKPSDSSWVSKPEDIDKIIATLGADDRILHEALTAIWKYMDTATKAVVGVPQHNCENCGGSQEPSNLDDAIVPFDPISVFFMCHCPSIARYQKATAAMQDSASKL